MIGGLFKSASRLALVAAAGVLVGGVSAQAADLGGDCCADLEERVAELEATTVRKGNRKVSLTLSGSVHKSIVYWDDGVESNVYAGVDSINLSTRFRFLGEAKITPKVSAGYLLEFEGFGDINSSAMNQVDPSAPPTNQTRTTVNVRQSAWWIDHKDMGRIWVGLTDAAGQGIDTINLANTNVAAHPKFGLAMGGFFVRGNGNPAGTLIGGDRTWGQIAGGNSGFVNLSDETRNNIIKYVSPTMMGFIFSAAWGEDDMWDVALRYAGEFGGFKLAAGATYTQVSDGTPTGTATPNNHFGGCADTAGVAGFNNDRDCSSWVLGGSLMHVATGLFVSGSYGQRVDNMRGDWIAVTGNTAFDDTDTFWHVKAGIEQNWFGIGKTTLYGEYNVFSGTPLGTGGGSLQTLGAGLAGAGLIAADNVAKSEITVWGLGVVQSIDAAAMDLYLAFRNHSADLTATTTGVDTIGVTGVKDLQTITMGGIIRF